MTSRATVLLADDHVVVAQGLTKILLEDFDVVGLVTDGRQLVDEAQRLRPDLIVSDMSMPGMGGLEALRTLRERGNSARFVFLTMHADAALAGEALRGGAAGYVLKQAAGEELSAGLQEVMAGHTYLSPQLAGDVASALADPRRHGMGRLTPRQRQVLDLIVEGHSMKQIAGLLNLSPRTVETHKYEMMAAIGVESTAELITHALRHGLTASC